MQNQPAKKSDKALAIFVVIVIAAILVGAGTFLILTISKQNGIEKPMGDCIISGCSSETCADEQLASACIWKPEFACYKFALCEIQSDSKCGWTETKDYLYCLKNL